jgi:regulator of replication initiation timing
MRGSQFPGAAFRVCAIVAYLLLNGLLNSALARGQESKVAAHTAAPPDAAADVRALADAVRGLQAQVQTLSSQVSELRTDEQRWHAEARELRSELEVTRAQLASHPVVPDTAANNSSNNSSNNFSNYGESSTSQQGFAPPSPDSRTVLNPFGMRESAAPMTLDERVAKLEDSQDLIDAKLTEQSQTKVESGSKYRLRLSGIVLFNLFDTRGLVDNVDFPLRAGDCRGAHQRECEVRFRGRIRRVAKRSFHGVDAFAHGHHSNGLDQHFDHRRPGFLILLTFVSDFVIFARRSCAVVRRESLELGAASAHRTSQGIVGRFEFVISSWNFGFIYRRCPGSGWARSYRR